MPNVLSISLGSLQTTEDDRLAGTKRFNFVNQKSLILPAPRTRWLVNQRLVIALAATKDNRLASNNYLTSKIKNPCSLLINQRIAFCINTTKITRFNCTNRNFILRSSPLFFSCLFPTNHNHSFKRGILLHVLTHT